MRSFPQRIAALLLIALGIAVPAATLAQVDWDPGVEKPKSFDWLKMKSGEWLKGDFVSLYDGQVEFDSDEFDILNLDWDDVAEVHTNGTMAVHLESGDTVRGVMVYQDGEVTLLDTDGTYAKAQIVSIAPAYQSERGRWSGKISLGTNARSGNTDQTDINARANVKRLTAESRLIADYIGNYSEALGIVTENNHRVTATLDFLLRRRLYARVFGYEYFRDPFQNIGARSTVTVGIGYQLIDTATFDWEITGGPGYQVLDFEDAPTDRSDRETSGVAVIDTRIDWDITGDIAFYTRYQFQKVNEDSGDQVHHTEIGFDVDLTKKLDFIITYYHDYIKNPAPDSDGNVPESEDQTLVFSLGWEF